MNEEQKRECARLVRNLQVAAYRDGQVDNAASRARSACAYNTVIAHLALSSNALPLSLDEAVAAGRIPVNQPISQATAQSIRQQATAQSIRQQPDPPPYRKFDPDDRLVEGFPTKRYD